jgi:hypothetical protein
LGLFVGPGLSVRGWCLPAEAAVGPEIVVLDAPVFDQDFRFEQAIELGDVEQLVTNPGVE